MKIEVGKFYKTRDTRVVAIFEKVDGDLYDFKGVIYGRFNPEYISYTSRGEALIGREIKEDIVSEWNPQDGIPKMTFEEYLAEINHNEYQNENPKTKIEWTQTVS